MEDDAKDRLGGTIADDDNRLDAEGWGLLCPWKS